MRNGFKLRHREPRKTFMPAYVVLDMRDVVNSTAGDNLLFSNFPIQDIIETFTSVPIYNDCNDVMWHEFSERFQDAPLSDEFLGYVEIIFEILMDRFYTELRYVVGDDDDKYTFHSWLDDYSIVMTTIQ